MTILDQQPGREGVVFPLTIFHHRTRHHPSRRRQPPAASHPPPLRPPPPCPPRPATRHHPASRGQPPPSPKAHRLPGPHHRKQLLAVPNFPDFHRQASPKPTEKHSALKWAAIPYRSRPKLHPQKMPLRPQ